MTLELTTESLKYWKKKQATGKLDNWMQVTLYRLKNRASSCTHDNEDYKYCTMLMKWSGWGLPSIYKNNNKHPSQQELLNLWPTLHRTFRAALSLFNIEKHFCWEVKHIHILVNFQSELAARRTFNNFVTILLAIFILLITFLNSFLFPSPVLSWLSAVWWNRASLAHNSITG